MTTPKVYLPELIDVDLIDIDPHNTNKQDRATFKALEDNIEAVGLDENIIVVPVGDRYKVVKGNHTFLASRSKGIKKVPAVIREDWDEKTSAVQGVFRNVNRGQQDKAAFTSLVNTLHDEHNMDFEEIQKEMGFQDSDEFASLILQEEKERERAIERSINEDAPKVKMYDDLSEFVNHLITEYGDTLHLSFINFPMGGKSHLHVNSNNALKNVLQKVVNKCKEDGLDLNVALAGLLQLGISQAKFFTNDSNKKTMNDIEKEITTDPDDEDLEL